MTSTKTLLIYRNPRLYEWLMRWLHGRDFEERYSAVAAEVPAGADVVELCPGDAYLYRHYLKGRNVAYRGYDGSPEFVSAGQAAGIGLHLADVRTLDVPACDVVVIQASLHIFHPDIDRVMRQMLGAARLKVLIAEPVRNLSSSRNPLVAGLARALTSARRSGDSAAFRFNEESLREYFARWPQFDSARPTSGGRELLGVFRGSR